MQSPQLDLTSPHLDALAVLRCEDESLVHVPVLVRPLDNLYKARYLLPEEDPQHLRVTHASQPPTAAAVQGKSFYSFQISSFNNSTNT